ncbi:MAG TPA: TatD family hydrolase [Myxococcales bacterium]|nr:TatD family hydrolase [Myxococcales bacterium]
MPLIDSHAHLDFDDYGDDLAATVGRAHEAGLVHVVVVGQWRDSGEQRPGRRGGMAAARDALELARTDRSFFSATAGIHPHDAARATASDLRELEAICAEPDCVAVGECGLDYHYDRSPREVQRETFAAQVRLAKALEKPVVVHTREADADTANILEREMGRDGGVIHCFTGDWVAAQRYLELGLHISLSGVLTFKAADALRDAAARIPLDRLLVETDCPFLTPVPHRGKRNEPAYVRLTAECLARIRAIAVEDVGRATTENARRALRLPL